MKCDQCGFVLPCRQDNPVDEAVLCAECLKDLVAPEIQMVVDNRVIEDIKSMLDDEGIETVDEV